MESEINSEIFDYEMCVHLFGAISCPSSNYALKRTAVDNNNFSGVNASETVM